MADFIARIRAELDTKGVLSQLKNITKDQTVNIKVNITGDTNISGSIQKILSGATNSASNAGKQAGRAFQNSMQKAINSGTYKFETGKFSADAAQFSQMLDRYQGQTSALLTQARNFQSEYTSIFNELQDHFNGTNLLDDKTLIQKFQAIQKAGDSFKNTMREINTAASGATKVKLSNDIVEYMNNNTKATRKYGEALKQLAVDAKNAYTNGDIGRVKDQFKELRSIISAEGLEGRSFFTEIGEGFKKVGQFVGTYRLIMESIKAIRQMVTEVKAVDAAMIELRKVSNATDYEMTQSFNVATESAKKYGKAISDVINSQADWARLGYGVKEAQQLADVTTLFQTVGDNMTQETSSQGLISILKGYQMDVSQAETIVDKLNEVANTSPIDTAGLTEALERSVSSMAMAGNTLDQSIGLITAANAVVQDPASVGTAFKTLTMRIRGAKTELEEAGLDTDGMAESVSKLRNELLDLTGVDIQLDDDTFKSTYQILKEISKVWNNLSDISRANVTELIAGKRQGNIISALMTNFDIAEQVSDTSANRSQGSAQRELENFQRGIEYSLGKFKASFQELATDFISSDLIKGVVDFGTQLMGILDATIGKFGALNTVLAGLGIAAFAKNILGVRTAIAGMAEPLTLIWQLQDVPTALGMSFESLAGSIGVSTAALGVFIGVAAGLAIIIGALNKIHVSADEALESFNKQNSVFESAKMEVDDLNSQLEETQSKIDALEAKGSLSLVEQEDLNNLKQQNIQLETNLKLREAELKLSARKTANEAHNLYDEWTTVDHIYGNGRSNAFDTSIIANNVAKDTDAVISEVINRVMKGGAAFNSDIYSGAVNSAYGNFDLEQNKDNINELISAYKSYQKQIDAVDATINGLSDSEIDELRNLEQFKTELSTKQVDTMGYIQGYADVMQSVKDAYTELQGLGIKLNSTQQNELLGSQKFLSEYSKLIGDTARRTQEALDNIFKDRDFNSTFEKLSEEYAKGNVDAIRKIAESNTALQKALSDSNISTDDFITYIANKFDPDKLNIDAVKTQLKKMFADGRADLETEWDTFIADKSDEEIAIFYKYINANGIDLSTIAPDNLETTITLAIEASGAVKIDEVSEKFNNAIDGSKTILDTIDEVNSALNSQSTGNVISPDTFNSDSLKEYRDALHAVNGTLQYNIDEVRKLNEEKAKEQINLNEEAKTLQHQKWSENAKKIAEYDEELSKLQSDSEEYQNLLLRRNSLATENNDIVDRCNYLDLYNQKLRESVGAYQAWLDAQNGGESGDMSSDVRNAMKAINDVFDTESSEYGKVGTHKYEAALEFLVPEDVSKDGDEAVRKYIDNLGKYFNGEKSGVDKFVQEGIDKQLFEYDPDSGELKVAAGKTMQDFADAMMSENGGWTMEAVQAMFGLLDDYTKGDFNFESLFEGLDKTNIIETTDATKDADEAAKSAAESYEKLAEAVNNSSLAQKLGETTVGKKVGEGISGFVGKVADYFTNGSQTNPQEATLAGAGRVNEDLTKTVHLDYEPKPLVVETETDPVKVEQDGTLDVAAEVNEYIERSGINPPEPEVTADIIDYIYANGIKEPTVDAKAQIVEFLTNNGYQGDMPTQDMLGLIIECANEMAENPTVPVDAVEGDADTALTKLQQYIQEHPLKAPVDGYYADETVETPEIEVPDNPEEIEVPATIRAHNVDIEGAKLPQETLPVDSVEVEATLNKDSVDQGVEEVEGEMGSIDGTTAETEVDLIDNASEGLDSIYNKAEALPDQKTINVKINTSGEFPSEGGGSHRLNGTAHAGGNWGTKKTETALVGELGREIVVDPTTGRWYTVGDNGAAFERIKKGSIIFNHQQSEALLSRGFVNGRGSAFLGGTAYVQNQKISGDAVKFSFGSGDSSSTSANTAAQNANTKATTDNTKQTAKNTKSAKKLGDLYDWVAVKLQNFAEATKKIADEINDYISSALKTSKLSDQMKANQEEIGANQRASWLYKNQANIVAKKTKMNKKLIRKAKSGEWEFEDLSSKDKEKVQAFLKYYDKYKDAEQKVRDLRNEQLELYEQWANMPAEEAAKEVEKLTNEITLLGNAYNIASSGASALAQYAKVASRTAGTNNLRAAQIARQYGSTGYMASNQLLDEQLGKTGGQMSAYQTAYTTSVANANSANANITASRNAATAAKNAVAAKAASILSSKKIAKNLNAKQKEALRKGQAISTKGMSGNTLNQITAYNALVSDSITKANSAADAVTKYNIAIKAQEEALKNLAGSQEEYAQMMVENEKKKFENIKNYYDLEIEAAKQDSDNFAKERALLEAYGNDLTSQMFIDQIDAETKQLEKMREQADTLKTQLKSAVDRQLIIEGSEEWHNMNNQILAINGSIKETDKSILELQDEMRKEVFYQALDKALKKAEELRSSFSAIKSIITEDMMFDDDGFMTDMGITALAMDVKEYESYLDSMGTLLEKREEYIKNFNDNNNDTHYSQKEYDEDMAAITKDIQDLLKNVDSVRGSIIQTVIKTSKAELDAIFDVIEARKTLLKKQKEYYDYDKSLKSKTKDLQLLEQQERALQNSAAAEDRAMLARIRAQKQEAREALDDTVKDHIYNLQIEGLDELKTDLQDNYDNYVKDLNSNLDSIVNAVNGATDTVTKALNTVNSSIRILLNSYGIEGLTPDTVGVPTFAGGTRRAGKSMYGLTNERGGEIVIGDRGVFFPLSPSSAVINSDLTNRLFGLANNYGEIMNMVGKNGALPAIQANEGNAIAPIINAPISIVGNQIDEQGVIRAINKQLPIISKTVQNDIRKDLRKSR